ncbi:hypothetical protein ILYODFUR_029050 [Ilyodon furcidens]|uniref:Uncharacterized protein n=1 Tax=Ilyodon furcidens TaxID=33524 RepID=A0ABV0T2L8_9TELE
MANIIQHINLLKVNCHSRMISVLIKSSVSINVTMFYLISCGISKLICFNFFFLLVSQLTSSVQGEKTKVALSLCSSYPSVTRPKPPRCPWYKAENQGGQGFLDSGSVTVEQFTTAAFLSDHLEIFKNQLKTVLFHQAFMS